VLDQLRLERVLRLAADGAYSLVTEPSRWASDPNAISGRHAERNISSSHSSLSLANKGD